MKDIGILIVSRGRPQAVAEMHEAWEKTAADEADPIWVLDSDDPTLDQYRIELDRNPVQGMQLHVLPGRKRLAPRMNEAAVLLADEYRMLGSFGDDHRPRTFCWSACLAAAETRFGTGVYYGRDGIQDIKLCTWWVMSSSIVKALGRMVPSSVEHLYCDNSVMDLARAAKKLIYLPEVYVEHMHPVAQKAEWDAGYREANSAEQYNLDSAAYQSWYIQHRKDDAAKLALL